MAATTFHSVIIIINQQVRVGDDGESQRSSASSLILCFIVLVIFLTLIVTLFAITAAVNLGHSDLNLGHSDLHRHKSRGQLPRQSTGDITTELTAEKQSPLEQYNVATELQLGQFVLYILY